MRRPGLRAVGWRWRVRACVDTSSTVDLAGQLSAQVGEKQFGNLVGRQLGNPMADAVETPLREGASDVFRGCRCGSGREVGVVASPCEERWYGTSRQLQPGIEVEGPEVRERG